MTKVEGYGYADWLSNIVSVGNWVVYSSKSTNVGINLGVVEYLGPSKLSTRPRIPVPPHMDHIIQIRVCEKSERGNWLMGRLITLRRGESAYDSVTRYFGTIPLVVSEDW